LVEPPIRLVVVDDHAVVLKGLEALLSLEPDMVVVTTCESGERALDAVRQHRPHIVLLDLLMPGLDGLAVLRILRSEPNPPRVIMLTASIEDHEVVEAIQLGVEGIFLKEMPPTLLFECIRKVHAGEQWIERQATTRAVGHLLRRQATEHEIAQILTSREVEIVRLAAQGLRTAAIADRLHVAEATVKTHLHNIYDKLHLDGRVALTLYAKQKGLV
jgi:DNA-binding NarL/FixJ family response regulator